MVRPMQTTGTQVRFNDILGTFRLTDVLTGECSRNKKGSS